MRRIFYLAACCTLCWTACKRDSNPPGACAPARLAGAADTFSYPVRTDSPAWPWGSRTDQYRLTAVPQSRLDAMSTAGMIETWLDHPMLAYALLNASLWEDGFGTVADSSNVFQTLKTRSDAAALLLERYAQMEPGCAQNDTGDPWLDHVLPFAYLEITLSQPALLDQLTAAEKIRLIELALKWYGEKDRRPGSFGGIGPVCTAALMGRLMLRDEYEPYLRLYYLPDNNYEHKILMERIPLQGYTVTAAVTAETARQYLKDKR